MYTYIYIYIHTLQATVGTADPRDVHKCATLRHIDNHGHISSNDDNKKKRQHSC